MRRFIFCGRLLVIFLAGYAFRTIAQSGAEAPGSAPKSFEPAGVPGDILFPETQSRINEIRRLLPETPGLDMPGLEDRAAWKAVGETSPAILKQAEAYLTQPIPELKDDLYLLYAEKGVRSRDYRVAYEGRTTRLGFFAVAEAISGEGRYMPSLVRELSAILEEKTWVEAAHDGRLDNFYGRVVDIDLGSSARARSVAAVLALLSDRLPVDLKEKARSCLEKRIFQPYLTKLYTKSSPLCRWILWDNNWNAVCNANVVMAALWTIPDRNVRAEIVAGAEAALPRYLSGGFYRDGFCVEGLDYWSYGFGHYVRLAEMLFRQTDGKIDLYAPAIVAKIAAYPDKLTMSPGLFPGIGDGVRNPRPDNWISAICASHFLGGDPPRMRQPLPALPFFLWQAFAIKAAELPDSEPNSDPLRGWFPDAQVLVCRPASDALHAVSALFKGGRNGVNHGHSDLGEFIVAYEGQKLITDPGGESYTASSFGPHRYDSKVLNSYGHGVPLVAGQIQNNGRKRKVLSRILESDFSSRTDRLSLDLTNAYDVPQLKKLEREFFYSREGKGSLKVTDRVEFSEPQTFGGALITYGTVKILSSTEILLTEGGHSLKVKLTAQGKKLHISQEPVNAPDRIRVGVDLEAPVRNAVLVYEITVANEPQ